MDEIISGAKTQRGRASLLALACFVSMIVVCATGYAQEAVPSTSTAASQSSDDQLRKRVAQLEAEMEQMREEVRLLRQAASAAPVPRVAAATGPEIVAASAATGVTPTANAAVLPAPTPSAASAAAGSNQTKAEAQDQRRPGFDVGPVRVIPYGTIYLNLFGNTGGSNNTDVPLFATPGGPGNVSATARETRLGLRLEGPVIAGAKSSGVVETDFVGGFPAIGIGEDFGIVRLRLAYLKLDWKNTSLEAGQDWTIFAPGNPVSLASVGTPEFAAAGNLFARIPQIRVEQRWDDGKVSWAGAVLASTAGDYPAPNTTPAVLQPGSGALSLRPAFESRLGLNSKDWLGTKKAATVGVSIHYGWSRVATAPRNIDLDVFGVAGDWDVPLGTRVSLAGEAFFGRNLAGFQGDVFQTFVPDFAYRVGNALVPGGFRAPGTRGGWSQLGFTPPILSDRLTFYESFGIDDPQDKDLTSLSKRDARVRNVAFASCIRYKFSQQLSWGFEYRRLETSNLFSGRHDNNHLNLAAAFSF